VKKIVFRYITKRGNNFNEPLTDRESAKVFYKIACCFSNSMVLGILINSW
jgi:hypothetical protein